MQEGARARVRAALGFGVKISWLKMVREGFKKIKYKKVDRRSTLGGGGLQPRGPVHFFVVFLVYIHSHTFMNMTVLTTKIGNQYVFSIKNPEN